ncbi:Brp/Blh family beta-carotene 15,15'-dioxygenase [Halorubrum gandharaense]
MTIVPGWLLLALTAVVFLILGELPLAYQLVPLAASVVLLGLPHGAVDHLAVARARGEPATLRWFAVVGLLYLVVGGAYAAVWAIVPAVAFAFFILLTWAHWGQGDLYSLVAVVGRKEGYPGGRAHRFLVAATRGSLPMVIPLVAFPGQYELVARTLVGLFDPDAAAALSAAFTVEARVAAAAVVGVLVVASLVVGYLHAGPSRPWLVDAVELLILVAFFLSVPPIFAVGLYFCVWHSLRHVGRLVAVDPVGRPALEAGAYRDALWSFARDAAPLTVVALLSLVALALVVPGGVETPLELVGAYLVLIAALTLPHTLIVAWMDGVQGVWGPG